MICCGMMDTATKATAVVVSMAFVVVAMRNTVQHADVTLDGDYNV